MLQLNARTFVRSLSRTATLDAVDDAVLDDLLPRDLDWLYLLGVWQTGAASRKVSRAEPAIRAECLAALPDLDDADVCGSCFAVTGYRVHDRLGGDAALERLRSRLADRGVALMLDFVPNHTAVDHPWVALHPERFVEGTEDDLAAAPGNWTRVTAGGTERILAHGRDPHFPGWTDTLQLDHAAPAVQAAMREQLLVAAAHGDGLRCDMAMLLLPDVFERTWGRPADPFWPEAIAAVRNRHPGFTFLAEVYWGREPDLRAQGFDLTYDKVLYDRLVSDPPGVVAHLRADVDAPAGAAPAGAARFLENHDEPRAATVFGTGDRHRAAAVATHLVPGLRFFQHGQREAWTTQVPMQLCRAPVERDHPELTDFYDALLAVLGDPMVHDGEWELFTPTEAWEGNPSHRDLLAFGWCDAATGRLGLLATVNLADHWAQGYVPLPHPELDGTTVVLDDRLGPARYERSGGALCGQGLYLDVGPWAHHVFGVTTIDA
ncbi:MAG: hypothetical protein KDB35_23005 [Acidimicrobiales bacterium]|nr:hypothetical protein [Acidimicrobiales bacterium]